MRKIYETFRTSRAALMALLVGLLMLAAQAGFAQATIATDKLDYAPGEIVEITGTGWHAGEEVSLMIMNLTYPELNALDHYMEWFVTADENGNIASWWDVTEDELGTELVLTALGQTSGYKEQVFFTDANFEFSTSGLPNDLPVVITFQVKRNNNNSISSSGTASFNSPGPSTERASASNSEYIEYSGSIVTTAEALYSRPLTTHDGASGNGLNTIIVNYSKCLEINQQPLAQSVIYGNNAIFSVTATGATSYQWQVNIGTGFSNITGETSSTLTVDNPTVSMSNYLYRVIVTGTCGTLISDEVELTVNKAPLTITADDKTKAYGAALPTLTVSYTGLVNGDLAPATAPSISTTATASSPVVVGGYPITATGAADVNYTISYVEGTLTVTPVALTITADDKSKYCGQNNPPLTVSYTGLVNGDTAPTTLPSISTTATAASTVVEGGYPITASGAADVNYTISYVEGTLMINGVIIDASASSQATLVNTTTNASGVVTLTATISNINTPVVFPSGVSVKFELVLFDVNGVENVVREVTTETENGLATAEVSGLAANLYQVRVTAGSGCDTDVAYLSVADPSAGFVTGGGWIYSSKGSLVGSDAEGKANFGFNAQYKKGKNNVLDLEGNTNFQFSAGDFHFKSSTYDAMTLVISGARATYRGSGTVNGSGNYGFMVSAIDGQINGGGGLDKFRIKVWNKDEGNEVVYDNQSSDPENADASTVIGGGSIVIHEVKSTAKTKSAEIATAINPVVANADLKVYPNPFSDRLRFEFVSPEPVNARIDLFDMTGRMVKTIFEQPIEGGVSYNAEFKPETVISGMYIYRMTMGEAVYNGKVVFKKE